MAEEQERNENYRENYTRLFNPILEAICIGNFNGRELKIIFFVIRCTYGWNKKCYPMSKAFIAEGTGLSTRHVCEILKRLIDRRVIIDYGTDKKSRAKIYGLNKKFSQWDNTMSTEYGEDEEGYVPRNGHAQNGEDKESMFPDLGNDRNGDICSPKSTNDIPEYGEDIFPENGEQKRNIKRNNKKEKEKKNARARAKEKYFLNPETEMWEEVETENDDGEE